MSVGCPRDWPNADSARPAPEPDISSLVISSLVRIRNAASRRDVPMLWEFAGVS